jgi:hypothetical protein
MTEDDTGCGDPPEAAQPQDGLASQLRMGELELDADGLPIQNRPATSQAYLIAAACLAGSLVSAGLAVAELAEYPSGVGNLAILGVIIGAVAGFKAAPVNEEKRSGWVYRVNVVAVGLATISVFTLVLFFIGQHGWYRPGCCG